MEIVTEFCPHCEDEVELRWDSIALGYETTCPICGQRLMLCDECKHGKDNPGGRCDHSAETGLCWRCPQARPSGDEVSPGQELLALVRQNPGLPIVPMVDGEVAADSFGYWLGAWGPARVDEYLLAQNDDVVVFRSDDDVLGTLERHFSGEEFEKLPETEAECRPIYDGLPWKRAIVVFVNPFS